jgi:hypothetical protein
MTGWSGGGMAVMPGGLDQDASHVRIAGLGDRPAPLFSPAGIFSGNQPDIRHNLPGRGKALQHGVYLDHINLIKRRKCMKGIGIIFVFLIVITSTVYSSNAAGPPDERARSAYRLILSEADNNKDGKLSISECKSIYKDSVIADKNCNFWDINKDGVITEDEYVKKGTNIGKKK